MSGPTAEATTSNDDLFVDGVETTETAEEVTGNEEPSGEEVETPGDPEGEVQSEEADQPTEVEVGEDALRIVAKKGISLDKFNEYLTRYKLTAEQVNANPSLAHLVLDKAATDAELAKQQPKEEPKKEAQDPPDLATHLADVQKRVQEYTDPTIRSHFVKQLVEAKDAEGQFAVLETAAANLVDTILAKKFGELFDGHVSSVQKANEERIAAHTAAWEPYAELNPGFKDALAAYQEAEKRDPELVNNPHLTPQQRMKTVALILGGRKAEAKAVSDAAEKGKQQGQKAERQATLGKAMGAGKSTGAMSSSKPKGNDDIFGSPGEVSLSSRLVSKKT